MGTGGSDASSASRWERVWWALHALAIVVSAALALRPEERLGASLAAVLPFALGLLAWHAAAILPRTGGPRRAMPDALLVAVSAALSAYLVARVPVFLFAAGSLFAVIYARVPLRPATLVALPYAAGLVLAVLPTLGPGFALAMGCMSMGGMLLALFIEGVVRQSDERKRLLDELAAARAELDVAERRAGASSERQRIARELHDTVTQDLVGLRILLDEADPRRVNDVRALVARALSTARGLVSSSQDAEPPAVPTRLRELAGAFRREAGCEIEVTAPEGDTLEAPVRLAVFRVAREALANAKKHARARRVTVTLEITPAEVLLDVHDDGIGFDASSIQPTGDGGFGLWSLGRSVEELGGALHVDSAPGEGTTISARIPLEARRSGVDLVRPAGVALRSGSRG